MTRGLYPEMPDSETLAESFLTKFPSINPLTAHAILSLGGMLIEFLEWSYERRIHAVQNYCVPDESLALFSALCKYGKQGKCINIPHKISISMDEFLHFDPLNQCKDNFLHPFGLSEPYDSWMSTGSEMVQDYKKHNSSLNDIFDEKQEFDFLTLLSSQVPEQYDSHISEGPKNLNKAKKSNLNVPMTDNFWGNNQGENTAMLNSLDWQNINNFKNRHKDLVGEVIDLTDSPMSIEDFSSFGSFTVFQYVSEINTGSDMLSSVTYPRTSFLGTNDNNPDTGPSNQENPIWDILAQGSAAWKGSLLKNDVSNHRATPLSKAILSAHPHLGSPWTIEFLNRIREKSRLHLKNLPPDTSASAFEISGNIARVPKRRSSSILEFFRYQGGSTHRKILEQRKQKRYPLATSSSKNEKTSASLLRTLTPIDKRARQVSINYLWYHS
ncbi:hypothetical protein REPUB_Repub08aG0122800 [Reevesia pubescens]